MRAVALERYLVAHFLRQGFNSLCENMVGMVRPRSDVRCGLFQLECHDFEIDFGIGAHD